MSLVAILCIFSSIPMAFPIYGLHACIQYYKCCLTIALYRGTIKLIFYVIFLRIIPRTWLPLDAAILHSYETFMLAFIVNPKSFSFMGLLRIVPPTSYCMPVFPGTVCRHFHFAKLKNIFHFSNHLTNLSMSCFCLSPISLVFLNSLESSANVNMLPVTPSSKSFMYSHT